MSAFDPSFGHIETRPDVQIGHLQRRYAGHAVAVLWAALTEPDTLAQWLAAGTVEQAPGGRVHIDFVDSGIVIDSTLSAFEPERVLEYSWSSGDQPTRPLRWELNADGEDTVLELTVQLPVGEDIAKACAGFECHLEMLAATLEGVSIKFPFDLYQQARRHYGQ